MHHIAHRRYLLCYINKMHQNTFTTLHIGAICLIIYNNSACVLTKSVCMRLIAYSQCQNLRIGIPRCWWLAAVRSCALIHSGAWQAAPSCLHTTKSVRTWESWFSLTCSHPFYLDSAPPELSTPPSACRTVGSGLMDSMTTAANAARDRIKVPTLADTCIHTSLQHFFPKSHTGEESDDKDALSVEKRVEGWNMVSSQ